MILVGAVGGINAGWFNGSFSGDGGGLYNIYVSSADWANSANYASWDSWGYQLYGAGNIQWNFFGGSPNPGDMATFDGSYWSPPPWLDSRYSQSIEERSHLPGRQQFDIGNAAHLWRELHIQGFHWCNRIYI